MPDPSPTVPLLLGCALRLRCPQCGGGSLFRSWLSIRERCLSCGLRMERGEDGYVVGAYMFNCHPFSKTVFLAFDLAFRPADETESTS
ncbi:MAG: hypothetical protein SGJ01_00540 [Gemmatimonadota bacterium]|nr:hypothetical protein [Gemmatimonadota bacterium]